MVPPFRTFTRSLWSDNWGAARRLWSDAKPEEVGSPVTEAVNELARRAASSPRWSRTGVASSSRWENLWDSSTWALRFSKALLELKPVRLVRRGAGETSPLHKKPTGDLTNAHLDRRPAVRHVGEAACATPLEGKVLVRRPGASQLRAGCTSSAAEYSGSALLPRPLFWVPTSRVAHRP